MVSARMDWHNGSQPTASCVEPDSATSLVLNNASALGFGSVSIVNLFATLGDFTLSVVEEKGPENMDAILEAVKSADVCIYAPGIRLSLILLIYQKVTLRSFQKYVISRFHRFE